MIRIIPVLLAVLIVSIAPAKLLYAQSCPFCDRQHASYAYQVSSVVSEILHDLAEADDPSQEAKLRTLLFYYGSHFGLGEAAMQLSFATEHDKVWPMTRQMMACGYPVNRELLAERLSEYPRLPILQPGDLVVSLDEKELLKQYSEVTGLQIIAGYNVDIRDEKLQEIPGEELRALVKHGFFTYGRFSEWYATDEYDQLINAYTGYIRDGIKRAEGLMPQTGSDN